MSHNDVREKILAAFNELSAKSDFESITVFQIAEKAGVSRATFYRWFKDKYDVMNYNYSSLVDRYMHSGSFSTMEELFVLLLREADRSRSRLIPLFASEGVNSFYRFVRNYSFTAAANFYEYGDVHGTGKKLRTLSEQENVQLRIFASGAAGFYKDWIYGRYSLSAPEAAKAMAEILPPFMKGNLFEKK
jgi:AcrR family transcriptional regulator